MENNLFDSLRRYFDTLGVTGYVKQGDVDKLLILSFINNFLSSDTADFITESDYQLIDRALYCLYGSTCLIPYPEFVSNNNTLHYTINRSMIPRFSENYMVRVTEGDDVRFKDIDY